MLAGSMLLPYLLLCAALLAAAFDTKVCSPNACLDGSTDSSLLLTSAATGVSYFPGTYAAFDTAPLRISTLNATPSTANGQTVIPFPHVPVSFEKGVYTGEMSSWTGGDWQSDSWKSLYLPNGWYAVLGGGKVLWNVVSDIKQLPSVVDQRSILSAGNSACYPPCSSNGVCKQANTSVTATCECATGWSGSACDVCATGFYGTQCKACDNECSVCDDGLAGTGQCISLVSSNATCDCAYGTCTDDGGCDCAAGYQDSTSGGQKCSECAEGFFQDTSGNCVACPLGCTNCTLQAGTSATPSCTACVSGLSLSSASPPTCASSESCSDGQYWDDSTSTCESCSPSCSTCSGPNPADCLQCASPRVSLNGNCVSYDGSTGLCDASLSGLQGQFVVDNAKGECDACPAGCAACGIPSFSTVSTYSDLQCSACHDGYLMQDGQCVQSCQDGWYLPTGTTGKNGTCQRCDTSCASCIGSSTYCTRSASTSLLADPQTGSLVSTCPDSTLASNGTCLPCSPTCASCSSPLSSTACTSCPANTPVLFQNRCLTHCPSNMFWDASSSICTACDSSCASCAQAGQAGCTSCPDGAALQGGQCVTASCNSGGFAPGAGVCLSSFVEGDDGSLWGLFGLPAGLAALGAVGWWIWRERRRTREATRAFARDHELVSVKDGLLALRLQKVLGFRRWRDPPPPTAAGQSGGQEERPFDWDARFARSTEAAGAQGERERQRAKERWRAILPKFRARNSPSTSNANANANSNDSADFPCGFTKVDLGLVEDGTWKSAAGPGGREEWHVPPPPYVGRSADVSSSAGGSGEIRPTSTSKIHDLHPLSLPDSPDPEREMETYAPRSLYPPPRPRVEREREIIRSISSAAPVHRRDSIDGLSSPALPGLAGLSTAPLAAGSADGRGSHVRGDRSSLKDLWPAMGLQSHTRQGEGWI